MESKLRKNSKIINNLLVFFSICLLVITAFKVYHEQILKKDAIGLERVEMLSSSIQRLSIFEFEKNYNNSLDINLDDLFYDIFSHRDLEEFKGLSNIEIADKISSEFNYFSTNKEIIVNLLVFEENLIAFKNSVVDLRNDVENSRENLFEISEKNFEISTHLIEYIHEHLDFLKDLIKLSGEVIFVDVIVIGVLLYKKLRFANLELVRSQELSKDMYIDISTGLYNRSKCQELLNNHANNIEEQRERAIIIFDLNFLKQTNDSLGHHAGDMLISSFAYQLKEATKIFPYEIFIARYGGDEFMAYFSNVEEQDIKIYLKQLSFLVNTHNEDENNFFIISYAVGYSITTNETKLITTQELFDIADENMYKNKIEMKLNNLNNK
ncbi:MAG: diguanylate cyclase [bacterium]